MGPGLTVLIACHDLMSRSKVETTLRHMSLEARTLHATADVATAIAAARPAGVIIDLALGDAAWRRVVAAARASDPPLPLLAFGAHMDREAQRAAHAAGCDLVVANSRLARDLPALMERLLAASAHVPSGDDVDD